MSLIGVTENEITFQCEVCRIKHKTESVVTIPISSIHMHPGRRQAFVVLPMCSACRSMTHFVVSSATTHEAHMVRCLAQRVAALNQVIDYRRKFKKEKAKKTFDATVKVRLERQMEAAAATYSALPSERGAEFRGTSTLNLSRGKK